MASPSRPFRNKKVERRTERSRQKHSVKRSQTKAVLRRRFEARIAKLRDALHLFPRVPGAGERARHLRGILTLLDASLEEKPQSHVLRAQRRLCFEALQEILHDPDSARRIELASLLDDPKALHVALTARCHPPASDRKSWN
jgi:hypothetical protein